MGLKVMIATGGTGGHLFPAQCLAEEFIQEGASVEFIGAQLSTNPYFDRLRWSYQEIQSATISFKNFLKIPAAVKKLAIGLMEAKKCIERAKPDVVVGFGSYHGLPALMAARYLRIPIVLHEANSYPGRVTRLMAPFACVVGVHFPEAIPKLNRFAKKRAIEIPLPQKKRQVDKQEALNYFGFQKFQSQDHLTLLIFGGSQGAEKLNEAIPFLLKDQIRGVRILHFIGRNTQVDALATFYEKQGADAIIKPFESRMDFAWEVADLYIGRAGANSVAELVSYAVPGLLIPYPDSADGHQEANARAVTERLEGGILLSQKELFSENGPKTVKMLFSKKEKFRSALLRARGLQQPSLFNVINQKFSKKEAV